jgi:hypothetical protein
MMLVYPVFVFVHGARYALNELNYMCFPPFPGTGGPAVGSSPAVSNNKASGTQPATNEVYLVWDDEAMSMVCFYSLSLVLLDYLCFWCIMAI